MADRNFAARGLLRQIAATGAQFLVRVKLRRNMPVHRALPDGSYLPTIGQMPVRLLTARIALDTKEQASIATYRLVPSLLGPTETLH